MAHPPPMPSSRRGEFGTAGDRTGNLMQLNISSWA